MKNVIALIGLVGVIGMTSGCAVVPTYPVGVQQPVVIQQPVVVQQPSLYVAPTYAPPIKVYSYPISPVYSYPQTHGYVQYNKQWSNSGISVGIGF